MQRPLIPPPFDDAAAEYAIALGVVDVHAAPDDASEVVTQALLGTPLAPLESVEGWRAVQLPDYAGWVPESALATRAPASERVAVVTSLRAPLFIEGAAQPPAGEVYATTALPLLAVSADDSARSPSRCPVAATACSRRKIAPYGPRRSRSPDAR